MANIGDTGTLKELDVREGDVVEFDGVTYIIQDKGDSLWAWSNFGGWFLPVHQCNADYTLIARAAPPLWRDMTAEQKLEILLADKRGDPIEWLNPYGTWGKTKFDSPQDDIAYRVRPPEPVVETVTLYIYAESTDYNLTPVGTINLRDGKPDCDSIKMEEL